MMAFACYTNKNNTVGIFRDREIASRYRDHGPIAEVDAAQFVSWIPSDGAYFNRGEPRYTLVALAVEESKAKRKPRVKYVTKRGETMEFPLKGLDASEEPSVDLGE